MTIVFLSRLFYPHIGGVEKHLMEIGKRLAKHNQVIIITELLTETKKEESFNGISIVRIDTGPEGRMKKFRIWYELWKRRLLLQKADIIHCHDVFFWYLPFRFLYPRKPVFTTFHGYESFPIKKGALFVRKISEKLSRGNICIGDFMKKWYGTSPTYVSYGAVTISATSQRQNDNYNSKSAIFIGRLDEQTGILTYVNAVAHIKKKIPGFDFLIVGDGPFKSMVEQAGNTTGFLNKPEKFFQTYRFAFVSRYLSILEALAAKRLVFAVYDNPVKEDYLKKADFAKYIVIAANEKELYEKVMYYLKQQKKEEELIEKGFEWVMKQSWENLVDLYLKLWSVSVVN